MTVKPLLLGPADVHAAEHLGPVAGLGAAGPGLDGEEAAGVVIGLVEQGESSKDSRSFSIALNSAGGLRAVSRSSASRASSISASRSSSRCSRARKGFELALQRVGFRHGVLRALSGRSRSRGPPSVPRRRRFLAAVAGRQRYLLSSDRRPLRASVSSARRSAVWASDIAGRGEGENRVL